MYHAYRVGICRVPQASQMEKPVKSFAVDRAASLLVSTPLSAKNPFSTDKREIPIAYLLHFEFPPSECETPQRVSTLPPYVGGSLNSHRAKRYVSILSRRLPAYLATTLTQMLLRSLGDENKLKINSRPRKCSN